MTREIKFRAWDKEKKVFWHFELPKFNGSWDVELLDKEVTQYTGLKDKNGKEIYEGDVVAEKYTTKSWDKDGEHVHNKQDVYEVVCSGCGFEPFAFSYFGDEGISNEEVEVIGNIYENPNLIKHEKNS